MTELETLKKKCLKKDGSPRKDATAMDLVRLKQLMDAEPLTKEEIEEAQRREEKRKQEEINAYKERMAKKAAAKAAGQDDVLPPDPALDKPIQEEHPRIQKLKEALRPFTQLEAHPSRPDDFILITRGVSITAGDVRRAAAAMNI